MGYPKGNNFSFSIHENQEKLSKKNKSHQDRLLTFQRHYIDDYVIDKQGKLSEEDKEPIGINIHFNFEESYISDRSNINISQHLRLHNPKQLYALLHHYIPYSSGRYRSVTREDIASHTSKYGDLYKEIEVRNASQLDIDGKIAALSRYFAIDLYKYNITYSNLNTSTLPLATQHLQYIMLSLRTGSHPSSSIDEINEYMRYVMREYTERSFKIHYVHDPWRPKDLSLKNLRINLTFRFRYENNKLSKHTLNKVLCIRNVYQFKALLNHYQRYYFQRSIPLQPSSAYEYLHDYIAYYNTLQVRMEEALGRLSFLFSFNVKKDKNDPSILNISYNLLTQSTLPLAIRHLELLIRIFNIGNDDINDNREVDRFLQEVRNDIYPLVKDYTFGSLYKLYNNKIREKQVSITPNTFRLNLNIIFKEHQYNFFKIISLQQAQSFIDLLDFFNFVPNDYLSTSNSPNRSIASYKDLLYIFDGNKDEIDPSILNLHYYPLSNDLNTSLIVNHLTTMMETFKREISINPNDNDTLDRYLTFITSHLSISPTHRLPSTTPIHLSISVPDTDPSLTTILLSPDDDIPGRNLDNQLQAMIVWNNLYNSSLDSPEEVSEPSSDTRVYEDTEAYWKAGWTGILHEDRMKKRRIEIREDEDDDDDDKDGILPKDPLEDTSHLGRLGPKDASMGISVSRDISALDGRLGGVSANFPNLLKVEEENISMMEDVD